MYPLVASEFDAFTRSLILRVEEGALDMTSPWTTSIDTPGKSPFLDKAFPDWVKARGQMELDKILDLEKEFLRKHGYPDSKGHQWADGVRARPKLRPTSAKPGWPAERSLWREWDSIRPTHPRSGKPMTNGEFIKYFEKEAWRQLEEYARKYFNVIYRQLKGQLPRDPTALKEILRAEHVENGKLGKLTPKGQEFFKGKPHLNPAPWGRIAGASAFGVIMMLDLYFRLADAQGTAETTEIVSQFVIEMGLWTAVGMASSALTGGFASPGIAVGMFLSFLLSGMDETKTEEFIRYSAQQDREDYPGDYEPRPSEITPPEPDIGPVPDPVPDPVPKDIRESRKSISKIYILIR
jgi:hypothetical protein